MPDETVYFAAVETLTRERTLIVDNGYAEFQNNALLFNDLLKNGPNGAVPQYPSGFAIMIAPFYMLFGIKGVMALNAFAAAVSVWLTYKISYFLFKDAGAAFVSAMLLGLCSFLVIYAKAVWPHALATAAVLGICWFILQTLERDSRYKMNALLAGLLLGIGISLRVDVVLVVPALLGVAIVKASRPISVIFMTSIGTLPGAILASWTNYLKFNVFSPLYYGTAQGKGGDISSYYWLLPGILLFLGTCTAIRRYGWNRLALVCVLSLLIFLAILIALMPQLQTVEKFIRHLAWGSYALWVDLRVVGSTGQATLHTDGTFTVFGLYKKAIVQSIPWIGVLALLLVSRPREDAGIGVLLCILIIFFWTPLFGRTAWHGGFSTNMRYFLPIVPFICILASYALSKLPAVPRQYGLIPWFAGLALTIFAIFVADVLHPQPLVSVVQHSLPLLFVVVLILCALISKFSRVGQTAVRIAFAASVFLGVINSQIIDLSIDVIRRSYNERSELVMSNLPESSFVYALIYEPMLFQIRRGDPIAARNRFTDKLDPILVDEALEAGYSVYVQSELLVDQVISVDPSLKATRVFEEADWMVPIWRIEVK